MKIIEALYTYGLKERKLERVLKKIKNKKPAKGIYLITLPLGSSGILEIYPYYQLLQPYYRQLGDEITVIGIASDYENAGIMVTEFVESMYNAKHNFDVKGFLGIPL